MSDVMLDLETLSVRHDSVILVIGAIRFNRNDILPEKVEMKDINKLDCFYKRIDIGSCVKDGFRIDADTEKWWSEQAEDVKYEALKNPDRVTLRSALIDFKLWFGENPRTCIWGNGSSFDCGILGEAYKKCEIEVPWKFFMERDLRTVMDLGNIRAYNLPQYNKHHALFDCYRQIIGFQKAMKNMKAVKNLK